ncbi:hypothetical protein DRV85_06605 [Rhodosalinus halophilus]|uniref:Glycosyltransferase 2-like domain-containing protein n=1 Tax=Rhodosalinus halophilus TaxID=2259333 RepID=A0A365UB27_9RHOB|nr:glycosyltransferase family A protein [Rhodosalinus halophilus]RBI86412.1 hypothetical protein DRV85_06605 [Rhodosalinus halophilus]
MTHAADLSFEQQVKLIKRSGEVHSTWYRTTYPDVAMIGMEPAEHYLRYGAELGRDPGKNFRTRFYLDTYPDAARSGLNPLVHYVLHGREKGYRRKPNAQDNTRQALQRVEVIRTRLQTLGITDRALADLQHILDTSDQPAARAAAGRELALWHLRSGEREGFRKALDFLQQAREHAEDIGHRARLGVSELLCHFFLADKAGGKATFERLRDSGELNANTLLAWSNFHEVPEDKLVWINQVLRMFDIPAVDLLPDDGRPLYDRLYCPSELPVVESGPTVSVLIAAYNAAEMIPTTLRSLQAQTWRNLEIIVIDDASPDDDTCGVVERFAAEDPRIRLIRMPENGGAYVARNRGLDEATGAYVTLHDADDWSHPLKIETQVRYMEANPRVMGCTSQQARATNDLAFTKIRSNGGVILFNTSSFMFRRAPMREKLGYWDTVRFGADSELLRRFRKVFGAGAVVNLETGPLSFQREADSSVTVDPVKGVKGFYYGVRHEYFQAQTHHHETATSLKYGNDRHRNPFASPDMMSAIKRSKDAPPEHFDAIFAGDFRLHDAKTKAAIRGIEELKERGRKIGIVFYYDYDLDTARLRMADEMRALVDGEQVKVIVFGDEVTCSKIHGVGVSDQSIRQRYTPVVRRVPASMRKKETESA